MENTRFKGDAIEIVSLSNPRITGDINLGSKGEEEGIFGP